MSGRILLTLLLILLASPAVFGREYEVFGQIESYLLWHSLPEADPASAFSGVTAVSADHRLFFDTGEFFAHNALVLSSTGDPEHRLYEAYLNLFPWPWLSLTLGKQRVNWGSGLFFSPSDSLHPDPAFLQDEYLPPQEEFGFLGATVLLTPRPDLSLSFHAALDEALSDAGGGGNGTPPVERLRWAVYGSAFLGKTEIAPSLVFRPDVTLRPGLSLSTELAGVVLFAEGGLEFLNPFLYPGEAGLSPGSFQKREDREAELLLSAGLQRSFGFQDGLWDLTAVAEYYYNGTGLTAEEADIFFSAVKEAVGAGLTDELFTGPGGFLESSEPNFPEYTGTHYLAPSLSLSWGGYVTSEHSLLLNLRDGSGLASHGITVTAVSGMDFLLQGTWAFGRRWESEFGTLPLADALPGRVFLTLGGVLYF